jgi:hypothetical protein
MRDPDLVQRAERAANALERAWDRWRTMHALGPEPSPAVSSYVGYSLEEPWGQPRVVFGVGAEEAERLAALLDGHDCAGPVYAELVGNPDWRRAPVSDPTSPAWSGEDHLSIPLQARPPAADMLGPARPADGPTEMQGRAIESEANKTSVIDSSVIDVSESLADRGAPDGVAASDLRQSEMLSSDARDEPQSARRAQPAGSMPTLVPQELVPLPPLPDQSPAGPAEAAYLAAAPVPEAKRPHGPGYRGPRYRGSPPQYSAAKDSAAKDSAAKDSAAKDSAAKDLAAKDTAARDSTVQERATPDPDQPPSADDAADAGQRSDGSAHASKPERPKPRQTSKPSRPRRQGPGAHEAWESTGEQPAAGRAV